MLAAAEAATQAVRDAAAAYRQRLGLMLTLPNFLPPPPEFSAHLEAMAGQAQQMLQSIINPPAEQPAPRVGGWGGGCGRPVSPAAGTVSRGGWGAGVRLRAARP